MLNVESKIVHQNIVIPCDSSIGGGGSQTNQQQF